MVYLQMNIDATEEATRIVCERIAREITTLDKFQDGVCIAIQAMSEMQGYKPELVSQIAGDAARVLVRVTLYHATRSELERLADPDLDAEYMRIRPNDRGDSFSINRVQYESLLRKFRQNPDGSQTLSGFMARVRKGYDCLMLEWCGMWLGIEKDGYTHS